MDRYSKGPEFVGDLTLDQLSCYLREGKSPDEAEVEWFDPALFKTMLKAQATP